MGGTSNDIFQGITIECDQLAPPVKDTHGDVTTRVVPSGIIGLEDFRSAIIDYTDIISGTVKRTDTDGIEVLHHYCLVGFCYISKYPITD